MISVTAILRVGSDPETRNAGGTPVVSFRGASSEKRKGEDVTTWVSCSFFGERAVKVAPYIRKGDKIAVAGSLSTREYETKGEKRTSVELNVQNLELLGTKQDSAQQSNGSTGRTNGHAQSDADESGLPF